MNSDKAQALLEKLTAGVEQLRTSDEWQEYLRSLAAFHSYSLNNSLLIHIQRPDARRVAGFQAWKKLGRHVQKGERGIYILAPMTRKVDDDARPGEKKTVVVGFRTVVVFDVAQTEGEALPEDRVFRPLVGNEDRARELFEALSEFARQDLGIPVTIEPIRDGSHGFVTLERPHRIAIREGNTPLHQVKTLAHELGHALLHLDGADVHSRPHREVEAESVAFVVLSCLGLDSAAYSFPYVSSWAAEPTQVLESGERIREAATRILGAVEPQEQPTADDSTLTAARAA